MSVAPFVKPRTSDDISEILLTRAWARLIAFFGRAW